MPDGLESYVKKFYVKLPGGSSKRTKTIGAEVPVDYDRWLSELAASSDYPEYKTKSDIVRDCLHLGLSIRTDPRYRESTGSFRNGILALDGIERTSHLRAMVDELSNGLYMTSPGTAEGQNILGQCEKFLAGLDDPELARRLQASIESFRNKL